MFSLLLLQMTHSHLLPPDRYYLHPRLRAFIKLVFDLTGFEFLNGYFVDQRIDSSLAGISLQCVPVLDSASANLLRAARCRLRRFVLFDE